MPSYPPRTEVVKKKQQLEKKKNSLVSAIKANKISKRKLDNLTTDYKEARLSLFKAELHAYKEDEFRKRPVKYNLEKLHVQIAEWSEKTCDTILAEFVKGLKESIKKI